MLQLTTAYVEQADRERTIESSLRDRQLLTPSLERGPDTTPAVRPAIVTDRPAGRRPLLSRPVTAPGG